MVALCKPERVVWIDGSEEEKARLTEEAVKEGVLLPLNQNKLPGCYLHRSNPNDVARVEHLTFICTPTKDEAGPTNNWMAPDEAYDKLGKLFDGSMKGRTMYVVPYVMGPLGSPMSKVGVELTDSIYVVLNMRIMTRMGKVALDHARRLERLQPRPALHARLQPRAPLHLPLPAGQHDLVGRLAATAATCCSARSASRCASAATSARSEGWLAEHMLILGVESPEGEMTYVAAAFPSACGKTNFAMMIPPEALQGLEDLDRRRRHRLDARRRRRPALGDQPRGRLLRRRAGHELQDRTRTR